ncbi:alpha-2-glucosyltransferase Alg10 [Chytriomyces cf. hyalinus JEL632]|nr:alpha-2-glucosyltransferase Alg10 [Chytriomyces cf. hyalinus JEL632]
MRTRLILTGSAVFLTALVALVIGRHVTGAYMDEIFHVPQAQRYCEGSFSYYDAKLTTPPGLYLVSLGLMLPTSIATLIASEFNPCSITLLRSTNLIFYTASIPLIAALLARPGLSSTRNTLEAIVISLFPVSYFFSFLYYTDAGSTFFSLLALLLSSNDRHIASAATSLIAMSFRQTNVIWMLYSAATTIIRTLTNKENPVTRGSLNTELTIRNLGSLVFLSIIHVGFLITVLWPYLLSLTLFGGFIVWNGGIVLGDKSNHVAQPHVVQMLYFVGFSTFFLIPTSKIQDRVKTFLTLLQNSLFSPVTALAIPVSMCVIAAIISRFTIEHPFLLADNRHYTFYIWKYMFRSSPYIRYALTPAYMFCLWFCWKHVASATSGIHAAILFACIALVLIPSPLLEFRYFIIPFMLLRLYARPSWKGLAAEFLLYVGVNTFTIWMFVMRPFEWPQEPGVLQRFMY